ncbi:MAG TPA: tetratricopeptide repeat protein [Terracidiphilus sp.]|nr:tetratricopeptide repeat protein [Terracidiphilus sp.]
MEFSRYLRHESVTIALLSMGAVAFFLFVTGISSAFFAQQEELAKRWSMRGVSDLNAGHFAEAIPEFRAALLYTRDDFNFRLGLAQALMGLNRTDEAYNYLVNLRTQHPENGLVNLELARIAVARNDTQHAVRFYHNAIYASWPGDEEKQERGARFELIGYLLKINAKTQAESELISLAGLVGQNAQQQARLGNFFLSIPDNEHALAAFRRSIEADAHNTSALAGAGAAAFNLQQYPLAARYLGRAVAANPGDAVSSENLRIAKFVVQMDPFQPKIRAAEKYRKVVADFSAGGTRLKSCPVAGTYAAPDDPTLDLSTEWNKLQAQVTVAGLRSNPDLVDTAMNLVFTIERQANDWCGKPAPADAALLLVARLREGS